jgi:hypothetical protein
MQLWAAMALRLVRAPSRVPTVRALVLALTGGQRASHPAAAASLMLTPPCMHAWHAEVAIARLMCLAGSLLYPRSQTLEFGVVNPAVP